MITVSLCMIVRDEEAVLGRCLDSVRAAADEIIIVDTGSLDCTRRIAEKYTGKVYDFQWCDDFSAARNFSFSKATKDYLLWLDADDVLPEASLRALLELKENLDPQISVVMMPYHYSFDRDGHPRCCFERERLIKNGEGFLWNGAVHEVISPRGNILHSDIIIEHRKLKVRDSRRNLDIYEKQLASGKELNLRDRFYYARELFCSRCYRGAAEELEHFLALPGAWRENRIEAFRLIAACREQEGRPDAALQALLLSLAEDAPRAEICCDIGRHFMDRKEYRAAAFWYETAASRKNSMESGAFIDCDCYDFIPYIQLSVCYYWLGNMELAGKYHRMAAAVKPEDAAIKYNEAFFC